MLYKKILRPILFLLEPEFAHDMAIFWGEQFGKLGFIRRVIAGLFDYENPALENTVLGIRFKNPIGLAGGFDKDMRLTKIIPSLGFGFAEIGSVTRYPCEGNPGTRLCRLPKDKSIIVYYGLKNKGAEAIEKKINHFLSRGAWSAKIPIGLNIAKTNRSDIRGEKSVEDYVETYKRLSRYFSYTTINISCPNTQDGCTFQDPVLLQKLLQALKNEKKHSPVFLKISNHLSVNEVNETLRAVKQFDFIDGFVVANLSKNRSALSLVSPKKLLDMLPEGGISGKPIKDISTNLISHIYKKTQGKSTIIGVGGVFDAKDAYEKIKAGASLVQFVTGLVYEGPSIAKNINRGLVELLKKDNYKNISEAIGVAA